MAFTCVIGSGTFDAAVWVRNKIEDPTGIVVSDTALTIYAETAAEEFSRHVPLDAAQIGNPILQTSTWLTIANQQRYVCNSGNGFSTPPTRITDVLYMATNAYSAGSEISYLALLPFSPVNRFLFTPNLLDSPTERIMRNQYLQELDKYGRGYFGVVRDVSGLLAVDLYPIPVQAGMPIYARYQVQHGNTGTGGNAVFATVPDDLKMAFCKFFYAEVLEQEGDRLSKVMMAKAGMTSRQSDPAAIERSINRLRSEATGMLLGNAGQVMIGY